MPFPRPTAFRLGSRSATSRLTSSSRQTRSSNFQRFGQQSQRRAYASTTEAVKQAGSDLPWLIGAVAVTVPGTWYILQPGPEHEGGHDDHGAHAKHEEEEEEDTEDKEDGSKEDETKGEDDAEEKTDEDSDKKEESEDSEAKTEEKSDDKAEKKDQNDDSEKDEGNDEGDDKSSDDSESKDEGEAKSGSKDESRSPDHPVKGDKKIELNSKGATKKRIDSTARKEIGQGEDSQESASSKAGDHSQNKMTGKQAGLSNTATRHSTDPSKSPNWSKKGEGTAETAKIMGTVDPGRTQPDNDDGEDKTKQQS